MQPEQLAAVPKAQLHAKLGRNAYAVWQVLCHLRTIHGECFPSITYLRSAVPGCSIRAALSKLGRAALLKNDGWAMRAHPDGTTRKVYVRQVFGGALDQTTCKVPPATVRWLANRKGWGGRRAGAGRPAKDSSSAVQAQHLKKKSTAQAQHLNSTEFKMCDVVNIQNKPQEHLREISLRDPWLDSEQENLGTFFGRLDTTPGPTYDQVRPGVPPFPDFSVVTPARIPAPPLLQQQSTTEQNARILNNAYRHALIKRLEVSAPRQPKDITRSRNWKALGRAVQNFISYELNPTEWALWSVQVWRDYTCKKIGRIRRPTLAWVYSAKRLQEQQDWYRQESQHLGGRVVYTRSHRVLFSRWLRMFAELRKTADEGTAAAIVGKHFPPSASYAGLVAAAQREAQDMTTRYRKAIAAGEFVW